MVSSRQKMDITMSGYIIKEDEKENYHMQALQMNQYYLVYAIQY